MELKVNARIEGEFEGWSGDTLFEFTNGQIWKQTEYHYHYKYMYRPEAKIWYKDGAYYLQVNNMPRMIRVQKIH